MLQGASRTSAPAASDDRFTQQVLLMKCLLQHRTSRDDSTRGSSTQPIGSIQSREINCWKRWGCRALYLWHCLTSTHTHAHLLPFMYTAGTLDLNQLLWWKACRQTLMSNFLIIQSHYPRGHHNTDGSFSRLCCVSLGLKHKACHRVQQ